MSTQHLAREAECWHTQSMAMWRRGVPPEGYTKPAYEALVDEDPPELVVQRGQAVQLVKVFHVWGKIPTMAPDLQSHILYAEVLVTRFERTAKTIVMLHLLYKTVKHCAAKVIRINFRSPRSSSSREFNMAVLAVTL